MCLLLSIGAILIDSQTIHEYSYFETFFFMKMSLVLGVAGVHTLFTMHDIIHSLVHILQPVSTGIWQFFVFFYQLHTIRCVCVCLTCFYECAITNKMNNSKRPLST